jgi:GPH family glycoside/pentoside/hexuronide:cation symporter
LGVLQGVQATLRNRQFLYVFFSTALVYVAYGMLTTNLPYFVRLVIGTGEGQVAIFQGVMILAMAATGPIWAPLNRRFSQGRLLRLAMAGTALLLALSFGIGLAPGVPIMAQGLTMIALTGITMGGYLIMVYSLMGNVVDYDELLTGRRREAIYYGTFSFCLGLGAAGASLVLPLLLQHLGYSAENPLGVRAAFPVAAALILAALAVFHGYRLGDTPEETRTNLGLTEA